MSTRKKRGFAVYAKVCVLDLTKNLGTLDAKEKLISFFRVMGMRRSVLIRKYVRIMPKNSEFVCTAKDLSVSLLNLHRINFVRLAYCS